ncbi:MAG TPA: ATP-binding protein [Candidatus Aphodovivens avistercoris]|nr:ATP-binding protein [Candidatus Aphodovivens avistercoris]
MFKRKAYASLVEWKRVSNGATAALIEGARRVGKSTVAEAFAQAEYDDYLLLDFSKESKDVKRNFEENIGDMDAFFRNLFLLKGKSLAKGVSVIIFDEVQLFPLARQAIKQLVKDGRYHYIETGSLISIKQNTADILIPSEEHRIKMYPMDFEEFLWSKGDEVTADAIREAFDSKAPLGEGVHRAIMKSFREYLAVGGMPQAVEAFRSGKTFEQIDFVKRSILTLYGEDLHKYDSESNGSVSAMFNVVSEQLGSQSMRYKFSAVQKGARYDRLIGSLEFLKESMTVNVCENVTSPDVLMDLHVEKGNFKMFMADTGLLVTQAMSAAEQSGQLYKALIFDKLGANLGMVTENMVAQMLVANGHALRFHEFEHACRGEDGLPKKPKKYEVDFLLVRGRRICPIEVKSSSYRTHKSLDMFYEKYRPKAPERYVLYTKDLFREGELVYLPLYMVMCL